MKFLFLIKWSYRFLQLCWLLSLEWLTKLEHAVQSLLKRSFWCPFLDPHLTTHPSNLGVSSREVTELGPLTLLIDCINNQTLKPIFQFHYPQFELCKIKLMFQVTITGGITYRQFRPRISSRLYSVNSRNSSDANICCRKARNPTRVTHTLQWLANYFSI